MVTVTVRGVAATGKHKTTKFVFLCLALLGAALIADLLWASSSSSGYQSIITSTATTITLPSFRNTTVTTPVLDKVCPLISPFYFL